MVQFKSWHGAAEFWRRFCATRLLQHVSQPLTLVGHKVVVGASIGISVFPQDGEEISALLKNADAAMYRAKEQGRNGFQYYSSEMTAEGLERLELESDLRQALERGEFLLHYQPQVDLRSGKIIGAEALIRWQHPERGMISPAVFIPIAEDIGLIGPIGEWVLHTACAEAKAWQTAGLPPVPVAVNVSGHQISHDHVVDKVAAALEVLAHNYWISLPEDKHNWFDLRHLVEHLKAHEREHIIQGQWRGKLVHHPKDLSLDYWIRKNIAVFKDTAQATNDVVTRICATGLFKFAPQLICPNSDRLCKGILLVNRDD